MAKQQPRQLQRAQIARNEDTRLAQQTQKPAEIKTVDPGGNLHLLANQETKRGANAMNGCSMI